jgi:hypothetical protein
MTRIPHQQQTWRGTSRGASASLGACLAALAVDNAQDRSCLRVRAGFVIGGISSGADDAITTSLLNLAGLVGLGRFSRLSHCPLVTGAGRSLCLGGSPSLRHNCGRRLTGCRRSFILKMSNHFDRQVTDCSENHSLHSVAAVSMDQRNQRDREACPPNRGMSVLL